MSERAKFCSHCKFSRNGDGFPLGMFRSYSSWQCFRRASIKTLSHFDVVTGKPVFEIFERVRGCMAERADRSDSACRIEGQFFVPTLFRRIFPTSIRLGETFRAR